MQHPTAWADGDNYVQQPQSPAAGSSPVANSSSYAAEVSVVPPAAAAPASPGSVDSSKKRAGGQRQWLPVALPSATAAASFLEKMAANVTGKHAHMSASEVHAVHGDSSFVMCTAKGLCDMLRLYVAAKSQAALVAVMVVFEPTNVHDWNKQMCMTYIAICRC